MIDQSVLLTTAAIAGLTRIVWCRRTKLSCMKRKAIACSWFSNYEQTSQNGRIYPTNVALPQDGLSPAGGSALDDPDVSDAVPGEPGQEGLLLLVELDVGHVGGVEGRDEG